MLEKVRGIHIKGKCFTKSTDLILFNDNCQRICNIYGRNGSGKSTIAKCFYYISQNNVPNDIETNLIYKKNRPINLEVDEKIFVFNEDYIDKNVKISEDGLNTIVLFGDQINRKTEIDSLNYELENLKKDRESFLKNKEEYDNVFSPKSSEFLREKIKQNLQDNWSVRNSEIKNLSIRSKVTEYLIDEICNIDISRTSLTNKRKEFNSKMHVLKKIKDCNPETLDPIQFLNLDSNFDDEIKTVLSKKINEIKLTEREQLIIDVIKGGHQNYIEDAEKLFNNSNEKCCPYCFRPLNEDYKNELLDSIHKVLNKDVEIHKAELLKLNFPTLPDYSQYNDIDNDLVKKIKNKVNDCNNIISKYKELVTEKFNNVYKPIEEVDLNLYQEIMNLNDLLTQLKGKQSELVVSMKNKKSLIIDLVNVNKIIARFEINEYYNDYLVAVENKKRNEANLEEVNTKISCKNNEIGKLQRKQEEKQLAIDKINNSLNYIFFSKTRLSIEYRDGKYYLKSNNNEVRPKDISIGERNIIALCYFFTEILSNQQVGHLYQQKELIVIDDPISSFDFENKVGLMSFLRFQIEKIVNGNDYSKIIMLSHDLTTVNDLMKIYGEIFGKNGNDNIKKCSLWQLENRELIQFNKPKSQYETILKEIYLFASTDIDAPLFIGNYMRRVLEVFSTFTYRKSITNVVLDEKVLDDLGKYSEYFKNLMYRLVLHGESHYEEQVDTLHDDLNFFEFISDEEKRKTAKEILCFIYLLNKNHVMSCLKGLDNVSETIKSWIEGLIKNEDMSIN